MYKATHSNHDFIHRVANHSTKGSRRGFCSEDTPIVAHKELVQPLFDQRNVLRDKLIKAEEEYKTAHAAVLAAHKHFKAWSVYFNENKHKKFVEMPAYLKEIKDAKDRAKKLVAILQLQIKQVNEINDLKKLQEESFAIRFLSAARRILPENVLEELYKQAGHFND